MTSSPPPAGHRHPQQPDPQDRAAGLLLHRAPTTCPVCSQALITLRLGCPSCGTELSGHFETCRYCRLDAADLAILEVFLRSRGNIRDVQGHLGVSYPTARGRVLEVLDRLGLAEEPPSSSAPPGGVAEEVTTGAGTGRGEAPSPAGAAASPTAQETAAVLAALAQGRMSVDEAAARLAPG